MVLECYSYRPCLVQLKIEVVLVIQGLGEIKLAVPLDVESHHLLVNHAKSLKESQKGILFGKRNILNGNNFS